MSAPATNSNDREPGDRSGAGGGRSNPYDARPPKNELEFRDHHLRRATEDEETNQRYIRLRWHQTAMRIVLVAAGFTMPVAVIIALAEAGFSPQETMHMFLIAGGGTGLGATARWLIQRRGGGRGPGGLPDSGQSP